MTPGGTQPRLRLSTDPASPQASILIPVKDGGAVLDRALKRIFEQRIPYGFEVIAIDSGSGAETQAILLRYPLRLHQLTEPFNHGLTRDLGGRLAAGEYLVYLTQDAVPCTDTWLADLLAPLIEDPTIAAVQGGIEEIPTGAPFFWNSNGPRFYFTRESVRWIAAHNDIGFSNVNAAIRRSAWLACPFGEAPILEDKKWQKAATAKGFRIVARPQASVFHSHDYTWYSLLRRCQDEGFGWRCIGEIYTVMDLMYDLCMAWNYATLLSGLARGQVRTMAELFFPMLRPWLVFKGNRFNRQLSSS